MGSRIASRALLSKSLASSLVSRSLPSLATRASLLRPLAAAALSLPSTAPATATSLRCFSTRRTETSLNDPSPNWSNRPPKETILLEGCDFEHWLCIMDPPEDKDATRDDIIDSYIKTLAAVVGSEEEARMKIYSVSTRCYYAFGALVSEEVSCKIKELPRVRWVLPDSYMDVKNKDYGGEPFINGQAVPYDIKYHEEWIRNNNRANERNRRNDRPRNFDRSRNYERRGNVQAQDQNGPPPPMQSHMQRPPMQNNMPPGQNMQPPPMQNNMPPRQNNMQPPPPMQNNMQRPPVQNNMQRPPVQNNMQPPPPMQNNMQPPPMQNNMRPPPPMQNNMQPPPPMQNNMPPPPPMQNNMPPPPPMQNNMQPPPPMQNNMQPPPIHNNMQRPPMQNMPPPPMQQNPAQSNNMVPTPMYNPTPGMQQPPNNGSFNQAATFRPVQNSEPNPRWSNNIPQGNVPNYQNTNPGHGYNGANVPNYSRRDDQELSYNQGPPASGNVYQS